MKKQIGCSLAFGFFLIGLFSAPSASWAIPYYWDTAAGAGNGTGGTGTNGTTWSLSSAGDATLVANAGTTNDIANFQGTAGTVTFGGSFVQGAFNFNTTEYTLTTSSATARTLTVTNVTLGPNVNLNLTSFSTNGAALKFASSSISGGTGSTITLVGGSSGKKSIGFESGAIVNVPINFSITGTLPAGDYLGLTSSSGTGTINSTITGNSGTNDMTFWGSAILALNGTIQGSQGIAIGGNGLTVSSHIDLNASNSYAGKTTFYGGTVYVSNNYSFSTNSVVVASNATIRGIGAGTNLQIANAVEFGASGASLVIGVDASTNLISFNGLISGTGSIRVGTSSGNKSAYLMNTNNTFTGGAGATNGNTLYVANLGSKADTKSAIGTGATITLGTPTSSGSLRWLGSAGNESSDKDFSLAGTNSILADGPTNATLTLSGAINSTNATNKTITFASYKSNTLTINGFINEFTGSTNSVVIGVSSSGTVVLGNATNSFSGPITISQTTTNQSTILQTASIGNSNSASPLGKNGTINIGNSFFPATLKYTGTGEMPNKVINLAGTTGGAILDQSGTGNLKFTSAMTATGAGAKTITLQGSSAGTGELGGNISDLGGNVISLKKSGTGTWTLSGSNSYSGDTTVSDGTLALAAGNINSTLVSITGSTNAILKLMATTSLASKASFAGDNSSTSTGTLDLNAGGGYTFNSYGPSAANPGLNMAFTNSSGSPVTVTFTNSTNYITDPTGSGGGKSIWNRSTNLTLVFNGKMEIGSSATNSLGLSGDGNFILNGSVTNSGGGTRGLNKIGSGTATLNADNSYNGPTVVSGGTLQIGPSGTLPVASSITVSNGAAIKFNQASGTNNVGPLTVAGTLDQNLITITSSGAVDLTGSTLKVNGTPTLTSYTLVSGTSLTGTPTLSPAISGYSLSTSGNDLLLVAAPSGLSYASISSTVGTAITSVNPTVTGTPTSYSIFPALPAGLTFSTTTGVISGAPSATAASATYTVTATNAGGSTTATFIVAVGKATPTISAAPAASDITFGQTLADSNLTGGTASTPGSFAFTTPSTSPNVGTADQGVTFTPNDTANYSTATASVSVTVGKATPTISAAPAASDITFGQTLADSNLTGGTASTPGSFAFTTPSTSPNVGTANQGVTFTPSDTVNYNTATTTVSVTVNKADATVTWPTAAAITYGDALSAATLSGGSGEGTFAFTSPLTVPNAGIAQIFEVTFTPTSANYKAATQMVSVMVNKAMPTITVPPTASPITYGQTLASSLLSSGTASVAGSFAFTTTSTGPSAGTASQGVTFTPADTANYSTATTSVSVTVNPASLSSSDITLVPTGDGSYTASATGVSGFTYSYAGRNQTSYGPSATAPTVAGFYTVTASANGNHSGSASVDYSVTGPVAVGDSLTKPAGNAAYLIPVSELLANDFRITNTSGATAFGGLTVSAVTSGSGNTATVAGAYIQFTPSSASTDTFTYTVTDGAKTATCTVTLTTETQAPTFRLQIVKVGTAAFSAPNTSVMHDFIGVPNQTYLVEYTTDLDNGPWTSAGNQSTGPKGSFSVTITKSGDFVSEWNTHMFFRARLVR